MCVDIILQSTSTTYLWIVVHTMSIVFCGLPIFKSKKDLCIHMFRLAVGHIGQKSTDKIKQLTRAMRSTKVSVDIILHKSKICICGSWNIRVDIILQDKYKYVFVDQEIFVWISFYKARVRGSWCNVNCLLCVTNNKLQ